MRDDQDPVDAEQVHAEDERLEGRRGDPAAGVAEDLRVAVLEPEHPERVDPRVHAGHDRDAGVGDAVEAAEVEVGGELPVGGEQVVEVAGDVAEPRQRIRRRWSSEPRGRGTRSRPACRDRRLTRPTQQLAGIDGSGRRGTEQHQGEHAGDDGADSRAGEDGLLLGDAGDLQQPGELGAPAVAVAHLPDMGRSACSA